MSALAAKHEAINLGQGFPDFPCDRGLIGEINAAMLADHNQYPPMAGVLELRHGIARKISVLYDHDYDPETEITITAGGTQGISYETTRPWSLRFASKEMAIVLPPAKSIDGR